VSTSVLLLHCLVCQFLCSVVGAVIFSCSMTESCSEDGGSGFALKLQELHGDTPRTPHSKLLPPGEP